jgi:hypothetical protein
MRLFQGSWIANKIQAEKAAVLEVNNLGRQTILDPALAGLLDKIVSYHTLEVATLEPAAKRGSRRDTQRTINDYGEPKTITIPIMDVRIPFQGDAKSFGFAPTQCLVPSIPCEVKEDHLLITLEDDQNLQRRVDEFIQQISQNLQLLRTEMAGWPAQLRERLNQVANARRSQIEAQNERNKNLDFPVD